MNKNSKRYLLAAAVLVCFGFWLRPTSMASSGTERESRATPEAIDVGSLYDKKCAECHGKDGRARSFRGKHTHARDLTDAQWQQEVTDERLYNSITNGKGKMPAFSKKLSEADINALIKYVRDLKK
jgi:mono/diheme cytochrome c family protein